MWRQWLAIGFSCGLLVACDEKSPTGPTQPVNSSFTLAPGESVNIQGASLTLRFMRVVTDSRCPGDATCITAGEALLAFEVVHGSPAPTTMPLELKTTPAGQVAMVDGYRVELQSVMPYPFASRPPIQPADYRATLQVGSNQ